MKKKLKEDKNLKEIKLNKHFVFFLGAVGTFIAIKGLEGMGSSNITGAVVGASKTDVTLVGFISFFVGAFLAAFAVQQIAKHHQVTK